MSNFKRVNGRFVASMDAAEKEHQGGKRARDKRMKSTGFSAKSGDFDDLDPKRHRRDTAPDIAIRPKGKRGPFTEEESRLVRHARKAVKKKNAKRPSGKGRYK
jgi:hypothetical protein